MFGAAELGVSCKNMLLPYSVENYPLQSFSEVAEEKIKASKLSGEFTNGLLKLWRRPWIPGGQNSPVASCLSSKASDSVAVTYRPNLGLLVFFALWLVVLIVPLIEALFAQQFLAVFLLLLLVTAGYVLVVLLPFWLFLPSLKKEVKQLLCGNS